MERRTRRGPPRGGRGPSGPKPVKEGDIVEVEVVEKSRKGDGVARVEGFVIFIPGAEPGQKVKVQIEKVGGTYAVGKIVT
ncbi:MULTISPECIES: TRAM domain-containing protein [Pyrobaculum]|uniref:Deoxyribonuclease/rho motif-related TRAM n=2 Tax=Pyrobaculum arsenaticum TaxID=121277 RepID=A4WLA0_PYRAR|nr:TRAM domain-containing protein [Pyrobaculum arsenaticum]ABP51167.1 deoxyribonuclease/rho motif-related TRAM [Pyrobaculum arsenaticum DSM 13514]MCY0891597.1 TRAM domain-containing protein [Pyrobaculum arsenaticum]NYR15109.1 TRAM domain-containing protein [Pyrobaculum arsenaticum]